jgi:phenylacetate-CoA ligase
MGSGYSVILEKIILPIGEIFFGITYTKYLKQFRRIVMNSEKEITDFQSGKLNEILRNAIDHSPIYQSLGIEIDTNDIFKSLKKFPVLEKVVLREQIDALITVDKQKLIKNSTSGSTGIQTNVYVTKEEQSQYRATQTLWWEWAGFKIGEPILQTGLATSRSFEKKLKDFFFKTYYLFAFGLTKQNTTEAFNWAKKTKPFLGGYASSLYVLSQLAEENNVSVKCKSAISWGDKLFDHYKKNIERVFECKIYETYGAGEGLMIASQKDLDFMYIMSPCVYVEILDDFGNEVPDGEMGHVVVTSLIHKAMPLIRYKLGDLAIKLPRQLYPERRELNLPILQKVVGRETDIVKTPSGKKLIVHSFTGIFEYFPSIKQFCVIQKELFGVEIEYIEGEKFELVVLDQIKNELLRFIGEEFYINFIQVEEILPTKSGKPQIIISQLKF